METDSSSICPTQLREEVYHANDSPDDCDLTAIGTPAVGGVDQSGDQGANGADDGAGEEESRYGHDLVARSAVCGPLRTRAEIPGRRLHSAQPQREHRPRRFHRIFHQGWAQASESDSASHAGGEYAGRLGREGRLRMAHLRTRRERSAKSGEHLPLQLFRYPPDSKRKGPGTLGQRAKNSWERRSENRSFTQTSDGLEHGQAFEG